MKHRNDRGLQAIEFFLPGPFFTYRERKPGDERTETYEGRCPIPKNRKKARTVPGKGFATVTDAPPIKAAERALVMALRPLAPPQPLIGPLKMDVAFVFVPPAKPKWRREAALLGCVHVAGVTHGDRDNLHKLLADAMEKAGFYVNDSQLVGGDVGKAYGEVPGYRVHMVQLREPTSANDWKRWQGVEP